MLTNFSPANCQGKVLLYVCYVYQVVSTQEEMPQHKKFQANNPKCRERYSLRVDIVYFLLLLSLLNEQIKYLFGTYKKAIIDT